VIADELTGLQRVAPWQGLFDGSVGSPESQAGWHHTMGFEFVSGEANGDQRLGGVFFQTNEGLRIGARGSFDPGSGTMSAIFALKLDF
jgi:hypothetical protein